MDARVPYVKWCSTVGSLYPDPVDIDHVDTDPVATVIAPIYRAPTAYHLLSISQAPGGQSGCSRPRVLPASLGGGWAI